jgi:HlyD family secretion protein
VSQLTSVAPASVTSTRTSSPRDPAALRDRVQSLRLDPTVRAGSTWSRLPWALCLLLSASTAYLAFREAPGGPGGAATGAAATAMDKSGEVSKPDGATGKTSGETNASLTKPGAAPGGEVSRTDPDRVALESKGYIIPAHQILVSPKVSGMLVALDIEEGRRVAKGDVLARIETTEYDADLQRAQANVDLAERRLDELISGNRPEEKEQARADLNEADENVQKLRAQWERSRKLREKKTISDETYDEAESAFQMAEHRATRLRHAFDLMMIGPRKERIDQARAEVALAKADLMKSQWRMDNTTVRAPITGTILKKNAEEGNIVNPVAFNGSFSLCDMADLSDLEVDLSIQERDIARVFRGQKCDVTADAFPTRRYEAVVDRLMPIADRAKGAVSVRVKVRVPSEEEGVFLKPDMAALVRFYGSAPATVTSTEAPKAETPQAEAPKP